MVCSASAQTDVDFRLAVVTTPTDTDTVNELPGSISNVCSGETYYVEVWASDVGLINTGVTSAYVDLHWPGAEATAVSVDHGSIYNVFLSGTILDGMVDELGGSVLSSTGVGIEPEWVRLAVIEFEANAPGDTAYTLASSTTGVAALGRGVVPEAGVSLDAVALTTQWCTGALLSCAPLTQVGAPDALFAVEIFVEGVIGMNAYQVEVEPQVTGTGSMTLDESFVDDAHADFVFAGMGHVDTSDPTNLRIAAVASLSQTVDVPGGWPTYLGTYVFRVEPDATNTALLEIRILPEPKSLLLDPLSQPLPYTIATPCVTEVVVCEPPTAVGEGSRYLQVTPGPAGSLATQAIRITSPSCPALVQYVDENGCLAESPTFRTPAEWGTVHITGVEIAPGIGYEATALCEDVLTEAGTASASTWMWADANHDYGIDVVDIQKVVQCAEGTFNGGTTIYSTDLLADYCGIPECDVRDVLAVLDAFRQLPYPGATPCNARGGDSRARDEGIEGAGTSNALITLVPLIPNTRSGSPLVIEAFVQAVTDLRAYQMQLSVSGNDQGSLFCDQLVVDTGRADYVFHDATSSDWPWVNTGLCRLSSSLMEGGIDVAYEPKYLGTFVLVPSDDVCGVFTVATDLSSSVLLDSSASDIAFLAGDLEALLSAPRDYDCDGDVDLLDYAELRGCTAGPGNATATACGVFDVDVDNDIDLVDWSAFQKAFTGSLP